jgi:SAM-dependent methyltransferase
MRTVDAAALAAAAEARFRSEYHYAVFEYLRSAKVVAALERGGGVLRGRVLDSGCGGGGTVVAVAEEVECAVGLDLEARFRDAGTRLAREKGRPNVRFVQGNGLTLPFADECFDLVLSHSVIEHVRAPAQYLGECRRVLRRGGQLYLSTAPYLSFAGAHLPRLRLPIPLHLLAGRWLAFRAFCWLGRYAPWTLVEGREANTFVSLAKRREAKHDDLLQKVTLRRLERWLAGSGLRLLSQETSVTGFFRRALPGLLRRRLERTPFTQDVMISPGPSDLIPYKPSP